MNFKYILFNTLEHWNFAISASIWRFDFIIISVEHIKVVTWAIERPFRYHVTLRTSFDFIVSRIKSMQDINKLRLRVSNIKGKYFMTDFQNDLANSTLLRFGKYSSTPSTSRTNNSVLRLLSHIPQRPPVFSKLASDGSTFNLGMLRVES